jgi:peptidoglycan/LPS O-acetylase OafA/YrhL
MARTLPTPEEKLNSVYDPTIDFIRFIAFFLVFFTHFINRGGNAITVNTGQWWNNEFIQRIADFGGQGVTLFFSLTGFLLGRLLIRECKEQGTVSVKAFYFRRILRIWPLYFVFIGMCAVLNIFSNSPTLAISELPYLATFTYNWGQIYGNIPGTMATITWSISVEEQIYLLFPVLFLLMAKKSATKYAIFLIIAGFASVLSCIYIFEISADRFTPAFLLPVGVGLLAASYEDKYFIRPKTLWNSLLIILLLILYILAFRDIASSSIFQSISYIGSAFLLPALLLICRSLIGKNQNWAIKLAVYIGRRSYGCYLFHWAIWTVMVGRNIFSTEKGGFSVIGVLVGFTTTVLVSSFSYKYFETPFLRFRKRFQKVVSP